ncbi:unnamed protein product [Brassica oleracea var. botrytis]|uniref:Uncharacterized protein n=2 Tax=Brassica oleracea TaxID=3712 RepID=A0A0D3DML4_BRAOL|nr:unnamed protein product [Brassica oleracea]
MIKITKRDNEYMEDGYSYINSMEMVNKGVDMLFELIRTGVGDNIPQSLENLTNLEALDISRKQLSADAGHPLIVPLAAQTRLLTFAASENKI